MASVGVLKKQEESSPFSTVFTPGQGISYQMNPGGGVKLPEVPTIGSRIGQGIAGTLGAIRGLTNLHHATGRGEDIGSALGGSALSGYTTYQQANPFLQNLGSKFGRPKEKTEELMMKPSNTGGAVEVEPGIYSVPVSAPAKIHPPTNIEEPAPMPFSPPTIEMEQAMLRQALENQAKWNEQNTIQYTSDGRPLFGKVNPYNEQVREEMYNPRGGFSDAFLGVNNPPSPPTIPTGPATPPPNLNQLEQKTAGVLGSAIGPQPNINNQPPKQSMTSINDDNQVINQFKEMNKESIQGG